MASFRGFVAAVRQGAQGLLFATRGIAGRQGVGDLAESGLDGPLVGGHRRILARLGRLRLARLRPPSKIGSVSVGRKLQEREPPSNRPDISALEVPKLPVRLMRWEERRARRADIRVCAPANDVRRQGCRASLDQLGRRAGCDILQQLRPPPRTPRNRLRGIVATQQQHQRVECLLFLPQVALLLGARLLHQAKGFLVVQRGGGTGRAALVDQGEGILAADQGLTGQRQAPQGAVVAQVGLADLGDQGDPCRTRRLLAGQVLLRGCVGQALDPTEEVQFVLRQGPPTW